MAKYFGADDLKQMRSCVYHGILLAGIVAVILTLSCALLCPTILHIMSAPEELFADAYSYLLVIFLGIPFTILYNLMAGILRAIGNSRIPFIFLAVSTVLNIGLDLFCISVLHWGCAGAAVATVMSQAISGILCLLYILRMVHIKDFAERIGLEFQTIVHQLTLEIAHAGLSLCYATIEDCECFLIQAIDAT